MGACKGPCELTTPQGQNLPPCVITGVCGGSPSIVFVAAAIAPLSLSVGRLPTTTSSPASLRLMHLSSEVPSLGSLPRCSSLCFATYKGGACHSSGDSVVGKASEGTGLSLSKIAIRDNIKSPSCFSLVIFQALEAWLDLLVVAELATHLASPLSLSSALNLVKMAPQSSQCQRPSSIFLKIIIYFY